LGGFGSVSHDRATTRHTEFAMSALMPRSSVGRIALLAGGLLAGAVAGCGPETFTYAKDAKAEGMRLYADSDYVDAAAAFANATRQDPRDYQSYYYLGASYQASGSYLQAIGAYRSCLGAAPMTLAGKQDVALHYRAIDNLAQCIAKAGTSSDEETALENQTKSNPNVDDLWMLAKIYRYSSQADEAVQTYTSAVLLDPTRFDVAKEAGLYEEGLKQNDRAAQTLKKAYADNPNDDEVNAALRRLGVVVGPSLRDESTLSHM
jgi:tetratricopeptide (TPR) repeat protein